MAPKKPVAIPVRSDGLAGEKCIVTGEVAGQTRKTAEKVLKDAGATIEKSLNKKVTLCVIGDKPGEEKLAKAEEIGCETITWDDLMEKIKLGDAGVDDDDHDDGEEEEEQEEEEEKPKVQKPKPKKTKAAPKSTGKRPAPSTEFLDGKTVIVTGTIPGRERKDVSKILENAGATVAKSLNKSVELVIIGTKPGPDKLKKIDEMGIETAAWDEVAEELDLEVVPAKQVPDVKSGDAPDSVDGMTLLITGEIDGHTRSTAQKVLEKEGAKFAKSLTNAVEMVVLGTNPGPDKLEKIKDKGVKTCNWTDLIKELEIKDSAPPKKKAKKT